MSESAIMMMAFVSGIGLGAIFFGGLYWTVRKIVSSQRPTFLFLGSLLLRMSITLTGFYFVADAHWQRLLLCLLGFFLARWIVLRLSQQPVVSSVAQGSNHAP